MVRAMEPTPPPYAGLTPDRVLDALDSVGIRGDGRLLALNSYENRVYQVWRDDTPPVVAKFYRPARWTDAQILEEHTFVAALTEREIPAVPALALKDSTLNAFDGFRFAVYARCGGRAPELERRDSLTRIGRYVGRIHTVGAVQPFRERPALTIESFGNESRDFLLSHAFIPPDLREPWTGVVEQALLGVRRCFDRAGEVASLRLHGDCHGGNLLWNDAGPHFVDFDDARMGPAVLRPSRASSRRGAAYASPRPLLGVARATLGRSGLPGRVPVVQHATLLAGSHPRVARADRADG
jgi:Ser/Thr protein kinase RdoA (MazF antagonist)